LDGIATYEVESKFDDADDDDRDYVDIWWYMPMMLI
jgi:hypothetical protein